MKSCISAFLFSLMSFLSSFLNWLKRASATVNSGNPVSIFLTPTAVSWLEEKYRWVRDVSFSRESMQLFVSLFEVRSK